LTRWGDNRQEHDLSRHNTVCLACGKPLAESLVNVGSLRCGDCRSSNERLDDDLVERWLARGAPFS
jgi:tRNA(Ile2) C34 agmatinyltransferase TiaS